MFGPFPLFLDKVAVCNSTAILKVLALLKELASKSIFVPNSISKSKLVSTILLAKSSIDRSPSH